MDALWAWLAWLCVTPGLIGIFGLIAPLAIAAASRPSNLGWTAFLSMVAFRPALAALAVAAVMLCVAGWLGFQRAIVPGELIALLALAVTVNTVFVVWFTWLGDMAVRPQ